MTWRYRPELDGLRTVAVYLVVLYHSGMAWMSGGFIGVDLFFVLSGFLVLNVMLAEVDDHGRLNLAGFYARRIRRLLPAAVLVIVLTSLLFVLTASLPDRLPLVRDAQSALLYVSNWHFIGAANDYFATDPDKSPFLHFWSLSIEEQFYVAFPLLVALTVKAGRHRSRVFLWLLISLGAASLLAQILHAQSDVNRAYYGTDTRLYQLLAGAALAVAFREFGGRHRHLDAARWSPWLGTVVGGLGIAGLILLASGALDLSISTRGILATAASLAAIAGVYAVPRSSVARLLGQPVPTYLGKISYGTYLWHWPLILVIGQLFDVRPLVLALLAAAVATGLAALSFQVFETPIRRSGWLAPRRWPTVGVGLGVSVLVAIVVVPPVLRSERSPAMQASVGAASAATSATNTALQRPVPYIDFAAVTDDTGPSDQWCTPDSLDDCLLVPDGAKTVVLAGDSQARMLAPAFERLAKRHGFRLYIDIVSSCPWQDGLYNTGASRDNQEQCHEARDDFYRETLPKMEPDLVIVSALARSEPHWQGKIVDREGRAGDLHKMQLEATERTADLVAAAGAPLVIVHSVMGTDGYDTSGPDPLDCLASAKTLGECVVRPTLDKPVVDGFYDAIATARDDVATIDINPFACPDAPTCLPMQGDVVVWKNQNHYTGSFGIKIRNRIWSAIQDTGLLWK